MAMLAVLLPPGVASAIEYEVFIDIDDEDELYDLFITEQISERTFNDVLDILRRGVNLNTATREELYALPNLTYDDVDRILAYRQDAGYIANPAALVVSGALSERKLASIAAFIVMPTPEGKRAAVQGFVRYRTVWTSEDDRVPPMALQARLSTARWLTMGAAATLDRNRLAPVTWDPNRAGLTTEGQTVQPRLAKAFVQWQTPKWGVIAGTYAIGFGQRLVIDTTGRYTPNGFIFDDTIIRRTDLVRECRESAGELGETPCPLSGERTYVTPDYRFQQGLRGLAIGSPRLELPVGWMQAYGFFSYQTRDIYQYEIFDRDRCDDPTLDSDDFPECRAPTVYKTPPDPLSPTTAFSYMTLPNMYDEIVGGANAGYWFDRRTHVGITGYGATTRWLVEGAELDFQDYSRNPWGGPWGAVGADMSWGRKWADIFVEVAHSFDDAQPGGGGGPAAILRHTATWDTHEIEASARYYDQDYLNPLASPISAPDELAGLRARDEAGGRLRYNGTLLQRWTLRAFFDVWGVLSEERTKLRTFARNDVRVTPWFMPGVWFEYQTRDLAATGRGFCYDEGYEDDDLPNIMLTQTDLERGLLRCRGSRYQVTGRTRFDPHRRVYLTLQYRHDFTDDSEYPDGFRQDVAAFAIVGANPIDPLLLRMRLRYDFDDIQNNQHLEQTFWAYLQASYRITPWLQPTIRYDIRQWLDDRDSTALRRPNPEHWLHFQIESRF